MRWISLATAYKHLRRFVEGGLVREVSLQPGSSCMTQIRDDSPFLCVPRLT
jgi:Fe2+ or Zn2+ uptake regulation protein